MARSEQETEQRQADGERDLATMHGATPFWN
jgi:hypothetical protein